MTPFPLTRLFLATLDAKACHGLMAAVLAENQVMRAVHSEPKAHAFGLAEVLRASYRGPMTVMSYPNSAEALDLAK